MFMEFVPVRYGKMILWNHSKSYGSYITPLSKKSSSITWNFGRVIRLKWIDQNEANDFDSLLITLVCWFYSSKCEPSYVDQFIFSSGSLWYLQKVYELSF